MNPSRHRRFRRWPAALLGPALAASAASTPYTPPTLEQVAAGLLPADGVGKLATGKWFPSGTVGCQFRLADPPSSFTQFFVSTHAEGLAETDCKAYRVIGLYKKGALVGPAAMLDKGSGAIIQGQDWSGGTLNGAGVALHANGLRYEGSFSAGKLEGPVRVLAPDGSTSKGVMAANRFVAGEVRSYDAAGQLTEIATVDSRSEVVFTRRFEGGQPSVEAPLTGGLKQGFGYLYKTDERGQLQKHAALWKLDVLQFESPSLALITGSPCAPLQTPFGAFRPLADSCSEAALATAVAPEPPAAAIPAEPAPAEAATADPATATSGTAAPPATPPAQAVTEAAGSEDAAALAAVAEAPPPEPPPVREHPYEAWSEDGRNQLTGLLRNGELVPQHIRLDGGARRYEGKSLDSRFSGEARYFEGEVMMYDGQFLDGRYEGQGLCRHNGALERCEHAYGERVDQLYKTRQELQSYKAAQLQEQQRIAEEQRRQAEAERQQLLQAQAAQQRAAQSQNSGFQWGKLAALGVGAMAGGLTKLPSDMQAQVITGLVSDSMPGQTGIANTQAAVQASAPAGSGPGAAATPAKPPKQSTTYSATCPSGTQINIPISYRTQACLTAAQEFAYAYSCNDADSFARVTQGCVAACGSAQCSEP